VPYFIERIVTIFSPAPNLRIIYVGFVEDLMALGLIFLQSLWFALTNYSVSVLYPCNIMDLNPFEAAVLTHFCS
jgi:hypothetical protein